MTDQEIFDRVVKHLLAQGQKAVIAGPVRDSCQYRVVKDGRVLKCAAGCLIPDSSYSPDLEGVTCHSGKVKAVLPEMINLQLLGELQLVHDEISVENWEWALRRVAERRGLTWPS